MSNRYEFNGDCLIDNNKRGVEEDITVCSYDDYESFAILLNQQDQRIAELEEQLKNAIVPKFETYQSIFYITQYYTSTKGNPEYDIISDKYYFAENENEIILGWNYVKDFNQRKYYYVRKDWVFATKEEALAKLEELKGENK